MRLFVNLPGPFSVSTNVRLTNGKPGSASEWRVVGWLLGAVFLLFSFGILYWTGTLWYAAALIVVIASLWITIRSRRRSRKATNDRILALAIEAVVGVQPKSNTAFIDWLDERYAKNNEIMALAIQHGYKVR